MSPLALFRAAVRPHDTPAIAAPRPGAAVMRLGVAGLPDDCVAHFVVRTGDGRTMLEGDARCGAPPTHALLPVGDYRLRWQPALAMIAGRAHTFVPTVLERDVRVSSDGSDADGSGTYVCLGSLG